VKKKTTPQNVLSILQLKMARTALGWSQLELAIASDLAVSTIADFERSERQPNATNVEKMRQALEEAGVTFLPEGVQLTRSVQKTSSVKEQSSKNAAVSTGWLTEQDLDDWASTHDCKASLPQLIRHLIVATCGPHVQVRFPANEAISMPGWDGVSIFSNESTGEGSAQYVPIGTTLWELSAQKNGIENKATSDFEKRTKGRKNNTSQQDTFVFVTPRRWAGAPEWAKTRNDKKLWREVRAYDGVELLYWIEQNAVVELRLATKLNKRPAGAQTTDDFWKEWSNATTPAISPELILANRDENKSKLFNWLESGPSVLNIQSTSTDEVVAFYEACLTTLQDDDAEDYRAKSLIICDSASARLLKGRRRPLIILLQNPNSGIANTLVGSGHWVMQAFGDESLGHLKPHFILNRPFASQVADALENLNDSSINPQQLARDCAGNLSILRRLLRANLALPSWLNQNTPNLVPAALVAAWDENSLGDKEIVARIAQKPFDNYLSELANITGEINQPIQKLSNKWFVASLYDTWWLLANRVTEKDFAYYLNAVVEVFCEPDPRFELPSTERWYAAAKNIKPKYSALLKHGLGRVLILSAVHGSQLVLLRGASKRAESAVTAIFRGADRQRWWSLANDFRLLAEVSPRQFLTGLEESLNQQNPAVSVLFELVDEGFSNNNQLPELLWALELLAWSPDHLMRVTLILAQLDQFDSGSHRSGNRPINTLKTIFCSWSAQTYATINLRLQILDSLRKFYGNVAWKLSLELLPGIQRTITLTQKPRWRDFSIDHNESTKDDSTISMSAKKIIEIVLIDVGSDADRWCSLLDRLTQVRWDRVGVLDLLRNKSDEVHSQSARLTIFAKLQELLAHYKKSAGADWSLSKPELNKLEDILKLFAPNEIGQRNAFLFDEEIEQIELYENTWGSAQNANQNARIKTVRELFLQNGKAALLDFSQNVKSPSLIGKCLLEASLSAIEVDELVQIALTSPDIKKNQLAGGALRSILKERGREWYIELMQATWVETLSDNAKLTLLKSPGSDQLWVWNLVMRLNVHNQKLYWQNINVHALANKSELLPIAIEYLLKFDNPVAALQIVSVNAQAPWPTSSLFKILIDAIEPINKIAANSGIGVIQHYVLSVFQILDDRTDLQPNELLNLEWNYFSILENSHRGTKVFDQAIVEEPSFFVNLLTKVYIAENEVETAKTKIELSEDKIRIAEQAIQILENWSVVPGTNSQKQGAFASLKSWVAEALKLASEKNIRYAAELHIGQVLANSPIGSDGVWPSEEIREVLEENLSDKLCRGFIREKLSPGRITLVRVSDHGATESKYALEYNQWASKLKNGGYLRTANLLQAIADEYEERARRYAQDLLERNASDHL
jgi:transcriptional regulator with XRE-family HTH domain